MNEQIVIQQLADVVYNYRGKSLLTSEYKILLGMLQDQTYEEIAQSVNYYPSYVNDLAREMMKIFSCHFRFNVKKKNFVFFCETYLAQSKI